MSRSEDGVTGLTELHRTCATQAATSPGPDRGSGTRTGGTLYYVAMDPGDTGTANLTTVQW